MTESASKTNTPDEMNNGKNIPVQEAIAARAPPKAKAPVSPMNIDALYRFWKRKPTHAPAIDAPNIERSDIGCTKYKSGIIRQMLLHVIH